MLRHRTDEVDDQLDIAFGSIIGSQIAMGGWPVLGAPDPYADSDADGLPDGWEDRKTEVPGSAMRRVKRDRPFL